MNDHQLRYIGEDDVLDEIPLGQPQRVKLICPKHSGSDERLWIVVEVYWNLDLLPGSHLTE